MQERIFEPPARATISLLEGHAITGYMRRFSPAMKELHFTRSSTIDFCGPFAAEHIAYVGFHRASGQFRTPSGSGVDEIKVHLAGNKTFLVHRTHGADDDTGFYATPSGAGGQLREIYFYRHSVRLLEVNLPLGTLLVREGKVTDAHLRLGLAEQQKDARVPIGQILIKNRLLNENQLEEAFALQQRRGVRVGEVLIESGVVTSEDVEMALSEQRQSGTRRIGQVLIDLNLVTEADMSATLAKKFGLPFVDLDDVCVEGKIIEQLPKEFIRKHRVLPIETKQATITIATADPLDIDTIDLVRVYTKKKVLEVVAMESQLVAFIAKHVGLATPESGH